MLKKVLFLMLLPVILSAEYDIQTIDFLKTYNMEYNGIGPALITTDVKHNRIITANTLSASVSVTDAWSNITYNIPTGKRALQHLKSEAMALDENSGNIYLLCDKGFSYIQIERRLATTLETDVQFESIATDPGTGNAFFCGRESNKMGFFNPKEGSIKYLDWLEFDEKLQNMNQTPPPPIRKVYAASELGKIIALDGYEAKLYLFDALSGKLLSSRDLDLAKGGRWHLAGYNKETHKLYVVTETAKRRVHQAAEIDILGEVDLIKELPEGFSEPIGIVYNDIKNEVYINYDNHPLVHLVDFANQAELIEIAIPTFGNDAACVDTKYNKLFIGSWAMGELYVVDLDKRCFLKKTGNLGIIPHMFAMTFNPNNYKIYLPLGASAVNGNFGAALMMIDPVSDVTQKIYLGWAPIDIVSLNDEIYVFNNEDQYSYIKEDLSYQNMVLGRKFPIQALTASDTVIYLSYGPHQSYWPVVYIWGAENGIMNIDPRKYNFETRRIPRQAMNMVLDKKGELFMSQNNWGREEQFLSTLPDEVRYHEINKRIKIPDTVQRETTQRILEYDSAADRLYLGKVAENDQDPGTLYVIDAETKEYLGQAELGQSPADLTFDSDNIYVSNFASNTISIIDKSDLESDEEDAGNAPLKICNLNGEIYFINHLDNTLQQPGKDALKIPFAGYPDNLFVWNGKLVITSHSDNELNILNYDPAKEKFGFIHKIEYPFGDTRFDRTNSAFYMNGQFGDAIFHINDYVIDSSGTLWLTDFLSGKLFKISITKE